MSMDAARLAPNNGRILNKLIDWLSDIINIIESRSNLFYFIVDVSVTSVAFVEWLPVPIFSARYDTMVGI